MYYRIKIRDCNADAIWWCDMNPANMESGASAERAVQLASLLKVMVEQAGMANALGITIEGVYHPVAPEFTSTDIEQFAEDYGVQGYIYRPVEENLSSSLKEHIKQVISTCYQCGPEEVEIVYRTTDTPNYGLARVQASLSRDEQQVVFRGGIGDIELGNPEQGSSTQWVDASWRWELSQRKPRKPSNKPGAPLPKAPRNLALDLEP